MENTKKIYLSSPTMTGEEIKYVNEAFETNWIAPLGKNVDEFEKELASYVGIKYAAALSAGTAAIHLALKLAGVKRGGRVFCSSLTFSASANPIAYEGAVPVFIDSEPDTWNMSPVALKKAFEKYPDTKVVIIVNLYGVPAKLDELTAICKEYNAKIIEDAAESLGAKYNNKFTGTFGEFGIFSFNGNKIITTSGGGMLVSNDEEMIKKARFLATQSREPARHYEHKEIGYNYRMSNVVAGIGRGQMKSLNKFVALKKNIYETYKKAFEDIKEIKMNGFEEKSEPNFWLSCCLIDEKSSVKPLDIMIEMEKQGIESRPIWKPMHLQPVFKDQEWFNHNESGKSVSETVYDNGLCLPSDIKNTQEDMDRIIKIVRGLFNV